MQDEKGIIWIASYPKSGNTWMRLLLGNYFYAHKDHPLTINTIQGVIKGDTSNSVYRDLCRRKGWGVLKAMDDIKKRETLLKDYIKDGKTKFLKTHSCYHVREGCTYFAKSFTKGFICVVRDPRDVLCSYSRHLGQSIENTFALMSDDTTVLGRKERKKEFTSSWDQHVNSFSGIPYPIMVVRYEDLLKAPQKVLGGIVQALDGTVDKDKLDFAIEHSSFQTLQSQEQKEGFREQSRKNKQFFAQGRAGGWKEILTKEEAAMVETRFEKTMKNLSYL